MSAPNASRNGPFGRPPRNSASSMRTPHLRRVRITRLCAGAERAVTSAVRIGVLQAVQGIEETAERPTGQGLPRTFGLVAMERVDAALLADLLGFVAEQ